MRRFYVFKDGTQVGSTAAKESAINLIHQYQKLETHPLLRSEFSIIEGKEEFVPYGHVTEQMKRDSADRMQQYINSLKTGQKG